MTRTTHGVATLACMRTALPAIALLLVVLSGCCHRRCRPATASAPEQDPAAAWFLRAHGTALKKARIAYATPVPGEGQGDRLYRVGDLYAVAPTFWKVMRRHICSGTTPTWFGAEECRLARRDWRWILAIMLHLGPGLGWGDYTDHVALDGRTALRVRAVVGVHEGLVVYFRALREELSGTEDAEAQPANDVTGTYQLDRKLLTKEVVDTQDDPSGPNLRSILGQTRISITLKADGTWTASILNPWDAMSGHPVSAKPSRGTWSAAGSKITFMPIRISSDDEAKSPLDYLEFTGVLDKPGFMRLHKEPPDEYPEAYGWPLRRK